MNEFELGQELRDRVTGFKGVAISRCEFINGCVQICLAPPLDKDGKPIDAQYYDVERLEYVSDGIGTLKKRGDLTGGPSHRSEQPPIR